MDQAEAVRTPTLLSPEAVIMLSAAVLIDGGELLLELIPVVGWVLSALVDVFALIFFGIWMLIRSGRVTVPKKTGARIAKVTRKASNLARKAKKLKWLRPIIFLIELIPIPFTSSLFPGWFLIVFLELKWNS